MSPAQQSKPKTTARPGDRRKPVAGTRPPLWVILSITVTGIIGVTLIIPVTPDIIAELGGGQVGLGWLVAASAAPGILLAPIIGLLSDRYGRREVVVPCLVVFGIAGGLSALAPSLAVLIALRVLQGAGAAGLINLSVTIIGDHWGGVERAKRIGQNAAALTTAIVIGPPVGGILGSLFGWRFAFLPLFLATFTAGLVWRRIPPSTKRDVSIADQLRQAKPYLRSTTVLSAMLAGFITFALVFGLFLTVMPLFLATEFGAEAALRGLVAGAPALTATAVALSLGRLRSRFGVRTLIAGSAGSFGVGFGVVAGAPAVWVVVIGVLIYGLGEGLLIPVLQDTVAGAAPESSRGSVVALFVGAVRTGQTTGPLVAAQSLAAVGPRPTFAIGAGLSMLMAVAVGTAAALRRGKGADLAHKPSSEAIIG